MACRLDGAKPLSEPTMDIVNWTLGNKLNWNLNRNVYVFIQENAFENVVWKMAAILSRPQCVKMKELRHVCSDEKAKLIILQIMPLGKCTIFQQVQKKNNNLLIFALTDRNENAWKLKLNYWWLHDLANHFILLVHCERNPLVDSPQEGPVKLSFDVSLLLEHCNKLLNKQSNAWWLLMQQCSCHCTVMSRVIASKICSWSVIFFF